MYRKLALLMIASAISFGVLGQQSDSCSSVTEIRRNVWPSNEKCDCSSGLNKKYGVKNTPGFSLVAVCDHRVVSYSSGNQETFGSYYFRGNATVEGDITHNQYASGKILLFRAPRRGSYEDFVSALTDMSFYEEDAALKAFKPPKLTPQNGCWKARANVEITSLLVVIDSGDQQGNFPLKYRVLNRTSYQSCEPEA